MESGVFFQRSGFLGEKSLFLGEKWAFLGEKVHRAEKRTEQYSRADQSRAEKSRYYSREQQSRTKLRMENDSV